jgi:hypothetical protein
VIGSLPCSDHFSASLEPCFRHPRHTLSRKPDCLTGKKAFCGMEQKRFVAVSSRFGNITAPALPQSNLIEVTLFELIAQR